MPGEPAQVVDASADRSGHDAQHDVRHEPAAVVRDVRGQAGKHRVRRPAPAYTHTKPPHIAAQWMLPSRLATRTPDEQGHVPVPPATASTRDVAVNRSAPRVDVEPQLPHRRHASTGRRTS